MFRRFAVAALAVVVAAVAVPAALGVRVKVRVEGKTQTIFGATEPTLAVEPANALAALEAASVAGEFYYHVTSTSFGRYVDQIGRYAPRPGETAGWVFKVNGVMPTVGADQYVVNRGDRVLWYWAEFSSGSPKTLDLARPSTNCFRAWAVDDSGVRSRAENVVFRIDGRRHVASASGRICLGRDWHKVRALKTGTIRSQVIAKRT